MGKLTLVIGGSRSGKSRFAEELARHSGRRVIYVATAYSDGEDAEMAARIAAHRRRRPAEWHTIEEPLDPATALRPWLHEESFILLDCLTVWLANWLMTRFNGKDKLAAVEMAAWEEELTNYLQFWLEEIKEGVAWLTIVSNEVGCGVVPPYPLGRVYRDLVGRANQIVAAHAGEVYWLVAGLPVMIKGHAETGVQVKGVGGR